METESHKMYFIILTIILWDSLVWFHAAAVSLTFDIMSDIFGFPAYLEYKPSQYS